MLIKSTKAPAEGVKTRLPTPASAASDAQRAPREQADEALDSLQALQRRAAWFSALAYHHHGCLTDLVAISKMEQFTCIADKSGSTVAFAFIFEGRAWLIFGGTNDWNDVARDVSCLPAWHFGFRSCFREIAKDLQAWIARASEQGYGFCVAGHSLGGALATLAAERLARAGRPVELLCTFGGPRVFAPWQAAAFDRLSANLPGHPDRRLEDVAFRFVDRYEIVSHVPPAIIGFRHVGREEGCGAMAPIDLSAEAAAFQGLLKDLADSYREMMKVPLIGPYLLAPPIIGFAIFRAAKVPSAHKMELYAHNLDPRGLCRIAHDGPFAPESRGRFRLRSTIPLLVAATLALGLAALTLFLLWQLALLFWNAPWATIMAAIPLALMTFAIHFSQKRKERRDALRWPAGKYSHIWRQE